ncbi:M48 family metalloprotease, partial [bacterium]|nr:M48 family metalloprotease [bacterium]
IALVLLGSLPFSLSKKGFSMRLMPMIPGLSTVCFLLAFLTAQWFWIIPADMIIELVKQEKVISHILTIANDSSDPLNQKYQQNKEEIHTILILVSQYLKTGGWIVIGFTLFCLGLSMIMILNGIDYCARSFLALHGLMKRPWQKTIETAVSGRKFLTQFRLIFIGVWLLCAGLTLIGIYYLSCLFFHALPGIWDDSCLTGFTRILQTSIYLADKAFGFLPGRSQSAVRIAWLIYGGCGIGLIMFSLSSLVYSRHTHFKKFINSSFIPTKAYQQVYDKLQSLSEKAGISCPKLVITEDQRPFACSHTFGLFKKTEFIEISSRCVNKFKDAEIEALMAHELSHHLNGDHRLHNLLRLLGRLTLVGDTFTCAIEDSFGYESKADETAVVRLQAEAQALKDVLCKIKHIRGAEGGNPAPVMEGFAAFAINQGNYQNIVKSLVNGVQSLPFWTRWCLAIKLYLAQYCSSSNTSYWHPSIELRKAALDALAAERN